ncbi:hypothetical protein AMATHDRAFT_147725 [Amanita thiersii Skay4041]|uniref:Metallothionein n=1 Tax=Amanita thiersii Skay4041 TaxID=703135 RepID=A0A2A9NM77_9AGAR|nr:hypothetical protein AMATHDRAFT_147725 [Amanita thiersii Skay4041]
MADCTCQTNCQTCGPTGTGCNCQKGKCVCAQCVNKAHTPNCTCKGSGDSCGCETSNKPCTC